MQYPLTLLEVLAVRPSRDEVEACVVVDDAAHERAYRVQLTYDPLDEALTALTVTSWWANDLRDKPLRGDDAPTVQAIKRYVECHDDLTDQLVAAHREWSDDMRVAL
jgi:hypothetical protein